MSIRFDGRPIGPVDSSSFNPPWSGLSWCVNNCPSNSQSDACRIVSTPARFGGKAWRIELRNGWKFLTTSGERTELNNASFNAGVNPQAWEGATVWRGGSWQFPQNYPSMQSNPGHAEVFQYKSNDNSVPVTSIEVPGNQMFFRARGGDASGSGQGLPSSLTWTIFSPIPRDVWIDVKWGVLYSVTNGWIRGYAKLSTQSAWTEIVDTSAAADRHPTLGSDWSTTFFNERSGLYRDDGNTATAVHFMSGHVDATTEADINGIWGGTTGPPALTITTTSLDSGTVGVAYSDTVQASNGSPPYTWSIVSGSLPAGLSLNAGSGVISGTPTAAGTSNFTVRAQDSASTSVQRALSISISAASTTLTITTTNLPQAQQNTSYSQALAATGGTAPYTWSIEGTAGVAGEYHLSTSEFAEIAASRSNPATPWVGVAWNLIEARANAALSASPTVASPTANYSAKDGPCTGTNRGWHPCLYTPGRNDGHRARELALVYRVTGTASYGNKARDFCVAWANGYNPPASSIGHYVAEPLGPVILLCQAFMDCLDRFSASEKTAFRNWASLFVPIGQDHVDHGVDDVNDNFWGVTTTIGSETQRPNAWGNNTAWQRAMVVTAAAAVGGNTLTAALNWNWDHTTPGGRNNGWTTFISNHIASTGETFEGRQRQSLGYGIWSIWAGAIIADIALHAGFHTDLFNFVTPSGNSLLQPWLFYGPAIAGGAWPYSGAETFMGGATQATIRENYRAAAELALRRVNPGSIKTQLQTIVAVGGNTQRGQNSEDHLTHENAVHSEARTLGGGGGSGQLPAGLSLATSTGVISGTPTTLGTSTFTVKVTDSVGATDTQQLSIEVIAGTPDPPPDPPPPTVLPDLPAGKVRYGNAILGSVMRVMNSGSKRVSGPPIHVPLDVIVEKLWMGIGATGSLPQVLTLIVYSDPAGDGALGALSIESAEQTKTGPFTPGWHSVAIPDVTLPAGFYWGGSHSGGASGVLQYAAEAVTGALQWETDAYPGAANPAGAMNTDNWQISFVIEGRLATDPPDPPDTTPPFAETLTINGSTAQIVFTENVATPAPGASAYSIEFDGAPQTPTNASYSQNILTLTLATPADSNDVVTFSYAQPGSNRLRDAVGNETPNIVDEPVTNQTAPGDQIPPAIVSVQINGATLTAEFSEALGTPPPAASTFSVTIGAGPSQVPTTVQITGSTLTLTLGTGALFGQSANWTWTDNGTNPIRDLAGNALSAISGGVTNNTPASDSQAPTIIAVSVNGPTLTATFSELLATPPPTAIAFSVSLGGSPQVPQSPSISGNVLTLTLSPHADASQVALWSYSQPASNQLRDLAGNPVANFSNQTVSNVTQAPPQPEGARPLRSFPFEGDFPVTRP